MQLAINVLKWPGMNQAFLFSLFLSTGLALLSIPYGKRRPIGTPFTWGEAMLASVYTFGVMFIAFGVVPHQFLDHAGRDLGWTKSKILYGPWDIFQPKVSGGHFPFTLQYEAIRDVLVVLIHAYYFALLIFLWIHWQKRGTSKSTAVVTSSYGRPLVKKA